MRARSTPLKRLVPNVSVLSRQTLPQYPIVIRTVPNAHRQQSLIMLRIRDGYGKKLVCNGVFQISINDDEKKVGWEDETRT